MQGVTEQNPLVLVDRPRPGVALVTLNRPDHGLMLVPGIWRELMEFSSGAVCLVLASDVYQQGDYIRSYEEFQRFKHDH